MYNIELQTLNYPGVSLAKISGILMCIYTPLHSPSYIHVSMMENVMECTMEWNIYLTNNTTSYLLHPFPSS